MIQNKLKEIFARGGTALGTFVTLDSPDVVEILALAGFDFVVLDNEHGPLTHATSQNLIRAAELRGITPIVRIPNAFESTILHTLDVGAHGIQVPQVNDAETAKAIVSRSKYKPGGSRGVAFPRSADFGLTDISRYFEHENSQVIIVTHCENTAGLENLDAICQIPEIDVIFLGPYDMSQSMGITGQVSHPKILEAARKVAGTAKKYGKAAGIYAGSGEAARDWARQGFQYITVGMDIVLFGEKCKQVAEAFKK
jgi:4-hydroxy-2-oxoheptanedioate aldolase